MIPTRFEYRFVGESESHVSEQYSSFAALLRAQGEFIKKNKKKLDYCKLVA